MQKTVGEIMQRDVVKVPANALVPEIERVFTRSGITGCPVVDAGGRVCGVLSRADIIRRLCVEHSQAEVISDFYHTADGICAAVPAAQSFEEIAASVGVRIDNLRADDVMSREVISIEPSVAIAEAARLMVDKRVHRLPVIESGRLLGIVSTLDIARLVAQGELC
jgi:predicted transcriptional regulator